MIDTGTMKICMHFQHGYTFSSKSAFLVSKGNTCFFDKKTARRPKQHGSSGPEKQILAAHKFLTGLRGLESIHGLRRKQADRIVNVIQSQKLTLEDAGKASDILRSELWGEELATVLKEAVAKQIDDTREPKSRVRLHGCTTWTVSIGNICSRQISPEILL